MALPRTLGALREAVRAGRVPHRSIKHELRANLTTQLRARTPLFPGIVGYDDTVVPQIVNAILSKHNFILLGLRGQAKTRLLRSLTSLLDPEIAVIPGCEIHDDPLAPICAALPGARRGRGRRPRHRMAATRAALRREAGDARRHHRGPDRGCRSDQGRPVRARARRRTHDALRPAAARQPRHLRDQRAAGSGEQGPGGPLQHPAGGRRPDQRLPGPAPAGRAADLQRESRGLHGPRQDHHPAQGPHRIGDPHALSAVAPRGAGHHGPGGVDRSARRGPRSAAGGGAAIHP